VVPEAPLEQTEEGLATAGEGWFVLNARTARWRHREGRGDTLNFTGSDECEAETYFPGLGVNLTVLGPGEPLGMYHWENDQEDFLLLAGEGLLIVEGEERSLGAWDFVHCPAGTSHIIVGAGKDGCVVVAVGSREHQARGTWGGYTVEGAALRHGAGVERETDDAAEAYARFPPPAPARYREGSLPGEAG
jgi:uncharacterized cupin superfamily protein